VIESRKASWRVLQHIRWKPSLGDATKAGVIGGIVGGILNKITKGGFFRGLLLSAAATFLGAGALLVFADLTAAQGRAVLAEDAPAPPPLEDAAADAAALDEMLRARGVSLNL
jgi:hypothetical protein